MKEKNTVIERIKNCYVEEDCAQVLIPYRDKCTIFNPEGILYSHNCKLGNINEYANDPRRKKFPFSDFPTYNGSKKTTLINQIYDFKVPYLELRSGKFYSSYVLNCDNEAVLITKKLNPEQPTTVVATREKALSLVNGEGKDSSAKHYIITEKGNVYTKINFLTDDQLITNIINGPHPFLYDIFYLVDLNGTDIKLTQMNMKFTGVMNCFEIELSNMPISKHVNYEINKNIKTAKTPDNKPRYNKFLSKQGIQEQKTLEKSLYKK